MNELYQLPTNISRRFILGPDKEVLYIHGHHEGADYFVVNATGETGATLAGVAKICEVPIGEIRELLDLCRYNPPSELLEIFKADQDNNQWMLMMYKDEPVYNMHGISAVCTYYALEEFKPLAFQRMHNFSHPNQQITIDQAITIASALKHIAQTRAANKPD